MDCALSGHEHKFVPLINQWPIPSFPPSSP
jgi:hypothetical protein